jgi:hypothetical protein
MYSCALDFPLLAPRWSDALGPEAQATCVAKAAWIEKFKWSFTDEVCAARLVVLAPAAVRNYPGCLTV